MTKGTSDQSTVYGLGQGDHSMFSFNDTAYVP